MAATCHASRALALASQQIPVYRPISRLCAHTRQRKHGLPPQRFLSTSPPRWAGGRRPAQNEDEEEDDEGEEEDGDNKSVYFSLKDLHLELMDKEFSKKATAESLRQLDELAKATGHTSVEDQSQSTFDQTFGLAGEERALREELRKVEIGEPPNRQSFWYDEDDPETNTDEHDEFDEDDIMPIAHGRLEEVRDMRHYARLIVWELPLLAKYAKPFEPPKDDQVFRWTYTTYMGEYHPSERKVVVQFAPDDLKLTPVQTEKLKKLAGPRYNPKNELIKMSCESYEHAAQNKKHLFDLVQGLIAAAKDPTDTFEDVPLDLRHHKMEKKSRFPKEWLLTDERRAQLAQLWQQKALAEAKRKKRGQILNGAALIDSALMEQGRRELEDKQQKTEAAVAVPKAGRLGKTARAR